MSKPADKKIKSVFILISVCVILMTSLILLISSGKHYSLRFSNMMQEISEKDKNADRINQAIRLLYEAENDFRIFTLTKDEPSSERYTGELTRLSQLLDSISKAEDLPDDIPALLDDKEKRTGMLLRAHQLSDSLWKQSAALIYAFTTNQQTSSAESNENTTTTLRDTTVVEPPLAIHKEHKGLLGRVKDAIFDNDTATLIKTTPSKIIITEKVKEPAHDSALSDKLLTPANLWSTVYKELSNSRNDLLHNELEMLSSNEALFTELRDMLLSLKVEIANSNMEKRAFYRNDARQSLYEINKNYLWITALILLFAGIILWALWHIYRNEQELIKAKKEADNYALLKSSFAATMSHEIRGFIHNINASIEQLNRAQTLSVKKEALDTINRSWDMLLSLVNNVLDYSKAGKSQLEIRNAPFSPSRTIKEVVDSMHIRNSEKNKVKLNTGISIPEELLLMGDEGELKQVLFNLISNALKFTPKGYVSVEASILNKGHHDALLLVSVKDTGRGISEDSLARIFDEFYQADQDKNEGIPQGSGLGLAIVKAIVDKRKGKINVISVPDKGSIFSIKIPYKITLKKRGAKPLQNSTGKNLAGTNILIVEDNLMQRRYLSTIIAREGASCHTSPDGQEALKLLMDHTIDIVLTDINMAGMSGTDLAKMIRNLPDIAKAQVPVIALTGDVPEDGADYYMQSGINDYLVKPFTPNELILKIKTCLSVRKQTKKGKTNFN